MRLAVGRGLARIDRGVLEAARACPGERPLPAGLVVAQLKPVDGLVVLVPHDQIEILVGDPAAISIAGDRFARRVREHAQYRAAAGLGPAARAHPPRPPKRSTLPDSPIDHRAPTM